MPADHRFPSPGVDARFPSPGVDARFLLDGRDGEALMPGQDGRFGPGASYAEWSPAADFGTEVYAWHATAKRGLRVAGGVSFLDDAQGGPLVLSAKDALSVSQPVWLANAGDGLPAIEGAAAAATYLNYGSPLILWRETLFYLMRPLVAAQNTAAILAAGTSPTAVGSFQIDAQVTGQFNARFNGGANAGTISSGTNFIGQWIMGVLDLNPETQQARHWINGVLMGTSLFNPAAPFVLQDFSLFTNRSRDRSVRAQFAEGLILHGANAAKRAAVIQHFKREWPGRITGWA